MASSASSASSASPSLLTPSLAEACQRLQGLVLRRDGGSDDVFRVDATSLINVLTHATPSTFQGDSWLPISKLKDATLFFNGKNRLIIVKKDSASDCCAPLNDDCKIEKEFTF